MSRLEATAVAVCGLSGGAFASLLAWTTVVPYYGPTRAWVQVAGSATLLVFFSASALARSLHNHHDPRSGPEPGPEDRG